MDTLTREAAAAGLASETWSALGCTARLVCSDPTRLAAAHQAVDDVVTAVDHAASRFRDDSELARINRQGRGSYEVSPMLGHLLHVALDTAAWSDGLLDPTVGTAMERLGYDRSFRLLPADGPAVTLVPEAVPGWQRLGLHGLRLDVPAGLRLDLGASAKSVAADLAARDAAEATGCGVLVSLGGDIAVAGQPPSRGWPVLVTDVSEAAVRTDLPPAVRTDSPPDVTSEATIALRSGGLATSGTRARRWRRGGSALHHIIDPRDGLPARSPWRTVSVTAATCALAGTAATTAVIRGTHAPHWLIGLGLPARLVASDGQVTLTPGWPRP